MKARAPSSGVGKTAESKRRLILRTAARLFAAKPYHEVKLDAIAAAAKLGKGTIYLYFKSKDHLYTGLILDGLETLLREVEEHASAPEKGRSSWEDIESIVDSMVNFGCRNPHLYCLLRSGGGGGVADPRVDLKRAEVVKVCERVIRRGVARGELRDPHPELTAQYMLAFARAAMLYAPPELKSHTLREHIMHVIGGIRASESPADRRTRDRSATKAPPKPKRPAPQTRRKPPKRIID